MDSLAKMHGQKKCWNNIYIFHLKSKLKLFIDSQKSKAKKLLKQWLDFHLKTRLKLWIAWLKCTAKKIIETTVRFFILKTKLKLWIDSLKSKAKKLLKQRLDFPFENKFKTVDITPKM